MSRVLGLAVLLLACATAARAEGFLMPKNDDGSAIVLGIGAYDSGLFGGSKETEVQFQAEYRHDWDIVFGIKPWIMGFVTTGSTLYGSAGFYRDFEVFDDIYITPVIGIGAWSRGNAEKDLGSILEFRTGAEATYRFRNGSRLGFQFFHLSNASTRDQNPGQESIMGIYVLPLRELKKLF